MLIEPAGLFPFQGSSWLPVYLKRPEGAITQRRILVNARVPIVAENERSCDCDCRQIVLEPAYPVARKNRLKPRQ